MFCCTLIALIFSQPALAFGAIKARLLGTRRAEIVESDTASQWRYLMYFGLLTLDGVLLVSGGHFLFSGIFSNPLTTFAHICGLTR